MPRPKGSKNKSKTTNMKNVDKKKCAVKLVIIYILICIGIIILDLCSGGQNRYSTYCKIGVVTIALVYLLINIIQLMILAKQIIARWIKTWCPPLVVILVTIAIPIAAHYAFYSGKEIKQDTFLTAYSTYLTFVGAFCLGYFLYRREENRRYEALKKKARLLYETMFDITVNLNNIDYYIKQGKTFATVNLWRSEYLEIKHLVKYEEYALFSELKYFFSCIESINKAIELKDEKRAKNIYVQFEQKEKYSFSEYNYMDAEQVLLEIALDLSQQKPWKKVEKEKIDEYSTRFFDVVNLWIYNYMIKNELTTCDADVIEYAIVDWLKTNPELKEWVKNTYENRKITAVIFKINLALNEKSKQLNYCWGEYSLKEST